MFVAVFGYHFFYLEDQLKYIYIYMIVWHIVRWGLRSLLKKRYVLTLRNPVDDARKRHLHYLLYTSISSSPLETSWGNPTAFPFRPQFLILDFVPDSFILEPAFWCEPYFLFIFLITVFEFIWTLLQRFLF